MLVPEGDGLEFVSKLLLVLVNVAIDELAKLTLLLEFDAVTRDDNSPEDGP